MGEGFFKKYESFYLDIKDKVYPKYKGKYLSMYLNDGTFYVSDNENPNKANIILKGFNDKVIQETGFPGYSMPI